MKYPAERTSTFSYSSCVEMKFSGIPSQQMCAVMTDSEEREGRGLVAERMSSFRRLSF